MLKLLANVFISAFWNIVIMVKCKAANWRSGRMTTKTADSPVRGQSVYQTSCFAFRRKAGKKFERIKILKLKHKNWNQDNFWSLRATFWRPRLLWSKWTWRNKAHNARHWGLLQSHLFSSSSAIQNLVNLSRVLLVLRKWLPKQPEFQQKI